MGGSCCDPNAMGAIKASLEAALPGVFVHSIATARGEVADIMSSYFGNLNDQVRGWCSAWLLGSRLFKMWKKQAAFMGLFPQGNRAESPPAG